MLEEPWDLVLCFILGIICGLSILEIYDSWAYAPKPRNAKYMLIQKRETVRHLETESGFPLSQKALV